MECCGGQMNMPKKPAKEPTTHNGQMGGQAQRMGGQDHQMSGQNHQMSGQNHQMGGQDRQTAAKSRRSGISPFWFGAALLGIVLVVYGLVYRLL